MLLFQISVREEEAFSISNEKGVISGNPIAIFHGNTSERQALQGTEIGIK